MFGCYETIKGMQNWEVMATVRHFVANEQDNFRQALEWVLPNALSSNIDDRTMYEVYSWPFSDSVKVEMLCSGAHWICVL